MIPPLEPPPAPRPVAPPPQQVAEDGGWRWLHAAVGLEAFGRTAGPWGALFAPVPLGAAAWKLAAGTTELSPRFSLPRGNWTMTVASRSEPSTEAVNLASVDLVADNDGATPLATSRIRVDEASSTVAFALDGPAPRLRLRGRGFQAEAVIESVRLSPATR